MVFRSLATTVLSLSLVLATPAFSENNQPPAKQMSRDFQMLRRNVRPMCKYFLLLSAAAAVGFGYGIKYTQPSSQTPTLSEREVAPNDSGFAVVQLREPYKLNGDQEIEDRFGNVVADSEESQAIFAFREKLFRLDASGELLVYRTSRQAWAPVANAPKFTQVVATETQVVGISPEGELFAYYDSKGGEIRFDEAKAYIDSRPFAFKSGGTGFTRLVTQTAPGSYSPNTVVALGEKFLIFTSDSESPALIDDASPQYEKLRELEQRLK